MEPIQINLIVTDRDGEVLDALAANFDINDVDIRRLVGAILEKGIKEAQKRYKIEDLILFPRMGDWWQDCGVTAGSSFDAWKKTI